MWSRALVFLVIGVIFEPYQCKCNSISNPGKAPWITLSDGNKMPALGLGTWLGFSSKGGPAQPTGTEVKQAVEWALDSGYRHIDTAAIYGTEAQVGEGLRAKIKDGAVKREDVFVTTKLWNDQHAKEAVVPALRQSLSTLGLDYVDLYLIHWPVAQYKNQTFYAADYVDTWKGMVEARQLGLARSIGISNFNEEQMNRILEHSDVKPAVLQVEVNLNLQQPGLLAYCRKHNITVTGYTPFGSLVATKREPDAPPLSVDDPKLVEMSQKHNKTVPQIALRYLVELGVVPIPKSVTRSRIEQNIDIFDFELNEDERKELQKFNANFRTIANKKLKDSPYYPF